MNVSRCHTNLVMHQGAILCESPRFGLVNSCNLPIEYGFPVREI